MPVPMQYNKLPLPPAPSNYATELCIVICLYHPSCLLNDVVHPSPIPIFPAFSPPSVIWQTTGLKTRANSESADIRNLKAEPENAPLEVWE